MISNPRGSFSSLQNSLEKKNDMISSSSGRIYGIARVVVLIVLRSQVLGDVG
jgi:hypothetical protein